MNGRKILKGIAVLIAIMAVVAVALLTVRDMNRQKPIIVIPEGSRVMIGSGQVVKIYSEYEQPCPKNDHRPQCFDVVLIGSKIDVRYDNGIHEELRIVRKNSDSVHSSIQLVRPNGYILCMER